MFDPFHSVRQRVRRRARLRIVPYRSIGTPNSVTFRGRVLANPLLSIAVANQSALASVSRMVSRFATFEVEAIPVRVRFGSSDFEGLTDREGYFAIEMAVNELETIDAWITAEASLPGRQASPDGTEQTWPIEARVVSPDTSRIVISDIDDTLLANGVGDVARTIIETIRGNYLTRTPVPGTPELYRWLTDDETHPIAYVSSSPWNLYDFLTLFMDHNRFPKGPLFLRDFGFNRATIGGAHGQHKVQAIQQVLALCPGVDAVLLGDSSQQDAEAFKAVIEADPQRNFRAFIRDVGDEHKAEQVRQLAAGLQSDASRSCSMSLVSTPAEIRSQMS